MISNQPKTRLHSQWDQGETSLNGKVAGREQIGMTPTDASARGLEDRATWCVCSMIVEPAWLQSLIRHDLIEGVVQLPTGAWWDPVEPGGLCLSGNPNVLTHDLGHLFDGPGAVGDLPRAGRAIRR